jgi:hypothetical protein
MLVLESLGYKCEKGKNIKRKEGRKYRYLRYKEKKDRGQRD